LDKINELKDQISTLEGQHMQRMSEQRNFMRTQEAESKLKAAVKVRS
jgi:hypothetical protein